MSVLVSKLTNSISNCPGAGCYQNNVTMFGYGNDDNCDNGHSNRVSSLMTACMQMKISKVRNDSSDSKCTEHYHYH